MIKNQNDPLSFVRFEIKLKNLNIATVELIVIMIFLYSILRISRRYH